MDNIQMDPLKKQMLDDVFDAFQMIAGGALVIFFHVSENAAGNCTCHLLHHHRLAFGAVHNHGRVLVQVGRFRGYGTGEFAVEMNHLLHYAAHRNPIDVHIPARHENRHLNAFAHHNALLVNFFDGNNNAIGRA